MNADAGTNWSGTLRYGAGALHHPRSVAELQHLVARSNRIRALGTRHSFSDLADTTGDLVTVDGLPQEIEIDAAARRVRVSAAMRMGDLAQRLEQEGFALAAMASLPHIGVGGAIVSATHGSGIGTPCLSAMVRGLELVTADGDLLAATPSSHPESFAGMVVSLGALGILTHVTLEIVPARPVRQVVYRDLPAQQLTSGSIAAVLGGASSVSLFTRWDRIDQVWVKQRLGESADPAIPTDADAPFPDTWHGATRSPVQVHPAPGGPPENCTIQDGTPGPAHERLPHFRLAFMPSSGAEIQSEFLIGREHLADAVAALLADGGRIAPALIVSEIRTVAADDLWLSMAGGRDSAAIHCTWRPDPPAIARALPIVQEALAPFAPRPHWAKVHSLDPGAVRARYPHADAFTRLAGQLDPRGIFASAFTRRYGLSA